MLTTIFTAIVDKGAQYSVIFYAPAFPFWLIIHLNIEYWRGNAKKAYLTAFLMWTAISGPLLLYKAAVFSLRWQTPVWMVGLGAMILILALLLGRLTFRNTLLPTILGLVELEPSKNIQPLLQRGIYSRTRHPIYLAHSIFILGLAMVTGFAANWGLLALDCVLIPLTILAEERELIRRYGDGYRAYMRRVPRFFPKWP